jgi:hypothetical protein
MAFITGAVLTMAAACSDSGGARSPASAGLPAGSATTPAFTRTEDPPSGVIASSAASLTADDAAPAASASVLAAPAIPATEPPPQVEIRNLGMHIGGEANTSAQRKPIRNAVSKHFEDMRLCYAKVAKPAREVTFGVDMLLSRQGGPATVTSSRSGFRSGDISDCLVEVFGRVEFPRPVTKAPMMVSYSVRFRRP